MLIEDALLESEAQRKLIRFTSQRRGLSRAREVYLSQGVANFLAGHCDGKFLAIGAAGIAVLETFTSGRSVSFALNPDKKKRSTIVARNRPEASGIVAIRLKHKKLQVRIFGAFACKDVLVLLRWKDRDAIKDFNQEVNDAVAEWNALLPTHIPLTGNAHDDYLSKPYSIG